MDLTKIVSPACIRVPLSSKDKKSAICELVEVLDDEKLLLDKKGALEAVLQREETRSTGIGSGVAVPHGKCKAVNELVMAVGISKEGIDFASVDSKPVYIVLLLVSPINQTGPHIQALAKISKLMLNDQMRCSIKDADCPEAVYKLLGQSEV